ncbi:hypothetical protein GCM10009582_09290 [Arthrobacter flavus]
MVRVKHEADSIRTTAAGLNGTLGPLLTGALAGNPTPRISLEWVEKDGPLPNDYEAARMILAHKVFCLISRAEGPDLARLWFIGGNPWLGDETPVTAIREGRFDQVSGAATALIDGTFSS